VNQSGRRRNGLWRKGFVEEPSLKFRMKGGRKDRRVRLSCYMKMKMKAVIVKMVKIID